MMKTDGPDHIRIPARGRAVRVNGKGAVPEFHQPVMVEEVLRFFEGVEDGTVLDGTVGGGGHAEAILERHSRCRLVAVDRDRDAIQEAENRLKRFEGRVRFLTMRFDQALDDIEIREEGLEGALLDLGVSSWQLEAEHRGFAFRKGLSLDMRMSPDEPRTAADLLNEEDESELARLFRMYGEERRARRLARLIVQRRRERPFRTSDDLVAALTRALERAPAARDKARTFQALRIALNQELDALANGLPRIRDALNPSGSLVVLSYHSLEDRLVKEAFRVWSRDCVCPPGLPVCSCRGKALGQPLTRGPLRPRSEEVRQNPRARSALLRAWRKAA